MDALGGSTENKNVGLGVDDVYVWKDVDYIIPYEGKQRQLLDDVSGYCIPGTLTALMGESGAGKTTLLNVLAQRVDFGTITGDMLVNGRPLIRHLVVEQGMFNNKIFIVKKLQYENLYNLLLG